MITKTDVGVDNVPKVRSVLTQWRQEDIIDCDEFFIPSRQPVKVKFFKPKSKEIEIGINSNTDLSLATNVNVSFSINDTKAENNENTEEETKPEDHDSHSTYQPSDFS